jgi:hypothetical protein
MKKRRVGLLWIEFQKGEVEDLRETVGDNQTDWMEEERVVRELDEEHLSRRRYELMFLFSLPIPHDHTLQHIRVELSQEVAFQEE